MNNKAILNKVKELLGMEVKLEQRKLEDGVTVIEADAFEPDNEVMIVTEDEQMIPLPVGEYVMEGGEEVLVVTEEGLISEIKAKEAKEEVEEEVVEEEAKKDEEKEEEMAEESRPIKKTVESIVKETFFTEIENLKKENAELKAKLETLSSDENTNEEVEETTNEEVTTTEVEEVAEVELSSEEPAAKPISYNPENKENTEKFNFAKNRPRNIMDTVLKRINK
jgi:hypothetical protein